MLTRGQSQCFAIASLCFYLQAAPPQSEFVRYCTPTAHSKDLLKFPEHWASRFTRLTIKHLEEGVSLVPKSQLTCFLGSGESIMPEQWPSNPPMSVQLMHELLFTKPRNPPLAGLWGAGLALHSVVESCKSCHVNFPGQRLKGYIKFSVKNPCRQQNAIKYFDETSYNNIHSPWLQTERNPTEYKRNVKDS